jgi:predicted esterase YcpF (UPF0227 family)
MKYIYLHDFNAGYVPDSIKVLSLSKLGDIIGITYDTFATYDEIFKYIVSQVPNDTDDIVFIGTALGGYWAAQMGKYFGVPSVMINQYADPYVMLRGYEDVIATNYHNGVTNVLTSKTIDTYAKKEILMNDAAFAYLPLIIVDPTDTNIHISEYLNRCAFVEHLDA